MSRNAPLPSFVSSACPSAGWASDNAGGERMAIASDVFIALSLGPPRKRWPRPRAAKRRRCGKARRRRCEVIGEKRDFYGRPVLVSAAEKCMPDRALTFGRYRLEPRVGLMCGDSRSAAHAQGACAPLLHCRPPRRGHHQGGAVRRGMARGRRRRCGAGDLHPGTAQGARRRCPAPALHRDAAPPRLPFHRQNRARRAADCRQSASALCHCPTALDRGAAVRQHERRSGSGAFRRRDVRGPDHRARAHPLAVRDRAQLDLRLQEPRSRHETGRARARRALRARRQRAPRRQRGCASARSSSTP